MDSSNSGSFQSSSGGAGDNDEFDSTTQTQIQSSAISSFFNSNSSTNFNPNLLQLPSSYPQPPTFYNPPPNPNPSSTTYLPPDFPSINPNPSTAPPSDHHNHTHTHRHQIGVTVKNPKKRTRASRRAPTTVLTTDTTNFRQMVQEFTGIPTAPFTTAPFSRRLDLFTSPTAAATGTGIIGSLNMNPLRPPQPQPSFLNANNNNNNNNILESGHTNNTPTATATTSGNYHFAPSTFLDLQNPMFSFQSLLQTNNDDFTNLQSASKRWRGQNGKLEGFEGGIIGNSSGGSKFNSGSAVGDQVQGNIEGSWICPSN